MVHQRAARLLLIPLFLTAFGISPTAAHADDGECREGKQSTGCVAACDDPAHDDIDDRDDDERDELRRFTKNSPSSDNRGSGKGGDEREDHLDIDDDCLPPAVVPEVSLVVLLPASAAGVLATLAYVGRRRRLRAA